MHTQAEYFDESYEDEGEDGGGCLSGFVLPPLAILVIGGLYASLAFKAPEPHADTFVPAAAAQALSSIFTPEVQFWSSAILNWADRAGLDPNLVATVVQIESCGDPFARSRAGAMGLFQVMPYHFLGSEDPNSPDVNARRGMDYLKRALAAANNDVRLALAGYNGGIGVISSAEWTWPAETLRYAYWGSGIYADAVNGSQPSARLAEWMSAGGSSLCRSAAQRLQIAN